MHTPVSSKKEWFGEWFDSPYYHLLYQHRDTTEARKFMDALASFMGFFPEQRLLDLACGKGRHSIYLNRQGYQVEGVDLSRQSIAHAQQFSNPRLQFAVHDMRQVYKPQHFDIILNLFTSFGFFQDDQQHLNAIQATAASLKPGGFLVIDFFNTALVVNSLVRENQEERDGITFHLKRYIEDQTVVKDIQLEDSGKFYHYQERVRALEEQDFRRYFTKSDLEVVHLFGNYQLDFFHPKMSDRMIFIVRKKK